MFVYHRNLRLCNDDQQTSANRMHQPSDSTCPNPFVSTTLVLVLSGKLLNDPGITSKYEKIAQLQQNPSLPVESRVRAVWVLKLEIFSTPLFTRMDIFQNPWYLMEHQWTTLLRIPSWGCKFHTSAASIVLKSKSLPCCRADIQGASISDWSSFPLNSLLYSVANLLVYLKIQSATKNLTWCVHCPLSNSHRSSATVWSINTWLV